ncbi:hypothetical protein EIP86_000875 [Pleurotus ostreatoroseus]|nr:hypothetical protein EIP86_000875 [Pleurotus ostreatoroseus]
MDVVNAEPGTTEAIKEEQPDKMSLDIHDCGSPMDAVHMAPGPVGATEYGLEDAAQIKDTAATEVATGQVNTGEAKHPAHQVSMRDRIYRRGASRNSDNDADIDQLASDQDDRVIYVKDSDEDDPVKDPDYEMYDDGRGGSQSQRGLGRSASGTRSGVSMNSPRKRSWKSEPNFPQDKADAVNASIRQNLALLNTTCAWEKQEKEAKRKYLKQMITEWSLLKDFEGTLINITRERLSKVKTGIYAGRIGPRTAGSVVKHKATTKKQVSKRASLASVLGNADVASALKKAGCTTISELLDISGWSDERKRSFFKEDVSLVPYWVQTMLHTLDKIAEDIEETEDDEDVEDVEEVEEVVDAEKAEAAQA